jgi:hypothetical protein
MGNQPNAFPVSVLLDAGHIGCLKGVVGKDNTRPPANSILSTIEAPAQYELKHLLSLDLCLSPFINGSNKHASSSGYYLFRFERLPHAQSPIVLSTERTPQRFRFFTGVYKQVKV